MNETINSKAMRKFSYGLFVLTACEGGFDNGCIINTAIQITSSPNRVSIALNKSNFTHDMIVKTGKFNISFLTTQAPFSVFQRFGFQSGRDVNKFEDEEATARAENGVLFLARYVNAYLSGKVLAVYDYGTHSVFTAEVTEAKVLSSVPSLTYDYYFANIKPKPEAQGKKRGFACKFCGYVYEGEALPADIICPICKHGAADFDPL